ncbi:MAG: GIY-YIG nuclease family protein [Bacteroidota bacterium]
MAYYAYLLISEEGYHYTGSTGVLDIRLMRHRLKTTHYTKKGSNWRVIYSKEFLTRSIAVKSNSKQIIIRLNRTVRTPCLHNNCGIVIPRLGIMQLLPRLPTELYGGLRMIIFFYSVSY